MPWPALPYEKRNLSVEGLAQQLQIHGLANHDQPDRERTPEAFHPLRLLLAIVLARSNTSRTLLSEVVKTAIGNTFDQSSVLNIVGAQALFRSARIVQARGARVMFAAMLVC